MELVNMDPDVMHFVNTMLCTDISTPVTGQLALDIMVNPPKPGDPSYDTYTQVTHLWDYKRLIRSPASRRVFLPDLFRQMYVSGCLTLQYRSFSCVLLLFTIKYLLFFSKEILLTSATLSQNAQRAQEFLNDLPGMSCHPAMGGIYLYPRLHLPSEIIEQAKV